jgi:hypothetical protein
MRTSVKNDGQLIAKLKLGSKKNRARILWGSTSFVRLLRRRNSTEPDYATERLVRYVEDRRVVVAERNGAWRQGSRKWLKQSNSQSPSHAKEYHAEETDDCCREVP